MSTAEHTCQTDSQKACELLMELWLAYDTICWYAKEHPTVETILKSDAGNGQAIERVLLRLRLLGFRWFHFRGDAHMKLIQPLFASYLAGKV